MVMISRAWKGQLWSALQNPSRRLILLSVGICVAALIGLSTHHQYIDPSSLTAGATYFNAAWGASSKVMGTGEPIVFSLIVWGNETAYETDVLLKTVLMYTSSPVDFHLIADPKSQEFLTESLSLVEKPVHDIRVFFYPISMDAMDQRLRRTAPGRGDNPRWGEMRSNHQSGWAGMMKLFFHEMLPDTVHRAMFVDSDAFFLTDPTLLWKEFEKFTPDTAIAIPSHADRGGVYNGTTRICSCIILLDLDRLRKNEFIYSNIATPKAQQVALSHLANIAVYGEPQGADGIYNRVGLGDQTFYMSIKDYMPELYIELPLSWEVTSCLMYTYGTGMDSDAKMTAEDQIKQQTWLGGTSFEGTLITPGILHFNCMYGKTYMESPFFDDPDHYLYKKWFWAVRYHQYYKWIWLNRGLGQAKTTFQTIEDVRFRDERLAGVKEPAGYTVKA